MKKYSKTIVLIYSTLGSTNVSPQWASHPRNFYPFTWLFLFKNISIFFSALLNILHALTPDLIYYDYFVV